jgi:OmpA-OmpF porin, OOP family
MKRIALATLLVLGSVAAQAAEPGAYGGASLGYVNADSSDFDPLAHGQSGTVYKFFGGYQFNKYLAAEASYTNLGTFNFTYDSATSHLGSDYRVKSLGLSAVGSYPIGNFTLFGRLGTDYNMVKYVYNDTISNVYSSGSESKNKISLLCGAGASYALTKNVDLRVEYENYGAAGSQSSTGRLKNLYTISSGLVYRF